jgi:hypothetical protein
VLKTNTTLTNLDLRFNRIGDTGAEEVQCMSHLASTISIRLLLLFLCVAAHHGVAQATSSNARQPLHQQARTRGSQLKTLLLSQLSRDLL